MERLATVLLHVHSFQIICRTVLAITSCIIYVSIATIPFTDIPCFTAISAKPCIALEDLSLPILLDKGLLSGWGFNPILHGLFLGWLVTGNPPHLYNFTSI